MIVGYARVSTDDQTLALQFDALQAAGCETVFRDTISGTKTERPGLSKALEHVRKGDMLVVWRLGRSLSHLIELIQSTYHSLVTAGSPLASMNLRPRLLPYSGRDLYTLN